MHKGIGVSPGVVVGVAHRVESVLGSIEPKTLDSPGQIPAEIALFRPGRRRVGGRAREPGPEGRPGAGRLGRRDLQGHLQIVNDPALLSKVHR